MAIAALWTAPTYAAESCIARPTGQAPAGRHWYYHLDRVSKRKCWYLAQTGLKVRGEAAKTLRVRTPRPRPQMNATVEHNDALFAAAGEAVPIPKDEAPAGSTAPDPGTTVDRDATDLDVRFPSEPALPVAIAEAMPTAGPPVPPTGPEPLSTGEGGDHLMTSFAGEPPLVWPVLTEAEASASSFSAWGMSKEFALLAGLTFALGGAFFAHTVLQRPARSGSGECPDPTAGYLLLLSRGIAALDPADEKARRATYGRARRALVIRLQAIDPPLPRAAIAAEQSALEAAITRLEARRVRPWVVFHRFTQFGRSRTGLARISNAVRGDAHLRPFKVLLAL